MKTKIIDKHCIFILGGCSFTTPHTDNKTWGSILYETFHRKNNLSIDDGTGVFKEYKTTSVHNNAGVSVGNQFILKDTVGLVDSYKHENIDYIDFGEDPPKGLDKMAIIQISSLNRTDAYDHEGGQWHHAPKVTRMYDVATKIWKPIAELGQKALRFYQKITIKQEEEAERKRGNKAVDLNGIPAYDYWDAYYEYIYSEEKHFSELLTNIIAAQTYFDKHNVPHRFFLGWDVLTVSETYIDGQTYTMKNNMWDTDSLYENKHLELLIEKYPHLRCLWDTIDWSKFWFFENEHVKYGGLNEWLKYNLDPKDWYVAENDSHPSTKAQDKFFKEVIVKEITGMLQEFTT